MSLALVQAPSPQIPPIQTAVFRVASETHDGYTHAAGSGANTNDQFVIANHVSDTLYNYQSFWYLTPDVGVVIPQGKVITSATMYGTVRATRGDTNNTKLALAALDNPTVPTSKAHITSTARGTSLTWNAGSGAWSTADAVITADVTTIVQAQINRTGWANNPLLLFWDFGTTEDGVSVPNTNHQMHSYNSDPNKAVRVEIVFNS